MIGYKIKIYRVMKGWSLDELSAEVQRQGGKLSKVALSKFERGLINPSISTVEVLAKIFNVKALDLVAPRKFEVRHLGFRKKHSLSKTEENMYRNSAELELEKFFWLYDRVAPLISAKDKLVMQRVNTLEEAEEIADELRQNWELGEGPIAKLATIMEKNGCFVKQVSGNEEFDAYSVIAENSTGDFLTGLIIYNENYSGDRQRFTLSHELGHFLIYNEVPKLNEKLANRFASAFLMPRTEIRSLVGSKRYHLNIEELIEYKKYFGASIQAIIYRLKDVGTISEELAKDWYMALSASGMKKNEPGEDVPKETPEYIRTLVMRAVAEKFMTREEAFSKFGVELKEKNDSSISRLAEFMKLPKEEQRRILVEQAQASFAYYEEDKELKQFRESDLSAIDD